MATVRVTALAPGDGQALADLWRDLWQLHETWGGYPAQRDAATYVTLARRLEREARVRGADPLFGQHVHLVARIDTEVVGQVEGWLERYGERGVVPTTCEVRSLVVTEEHRGRGVGRALLDALGALARKYEGGEAFLVAEVLSQNPALAFYQARGFRTLSYTRMVPVDFPWQVDATLRARPAEVRDAFELARLEVSRRRLLRQRGDLRCDPPRALEAGLVTSVAQHLAVKGRSEELLVEGRRVLASAALSVAPLEAPFVPVRRAVLGRIAVETSAALPSLVQLACRLSAQRGARWLEITDVPEREASLEHSHTNAAGAHIRTHSRIVGVLVR